MTYESAVMRCLPSTGDPIAILENKVALMRHEGREYRIEVQVASGLTLKTYREFLYGKDNPDLKQVMRRLSRVKPMAVSIDPTYGWIVMGTAKELVTLFYVTSAYTCLSN